MTLNVFYSPSSYDLDDCLSFLERERKQRFRQVKDQEQYQFAHCFKRHVLSHSFPEIVPNDWHFLSSKYGKPYVQQAVSFNMSHSCDAVAVAVLAGESKLDIGVDIECYRELQDIDSLLDAVCHPEEKAILLASVDKAKVFYRLWTAKEAILKANGSGLVDEMSELNCVQCLTENRCVVTWREKNYWVDCKAFEWGVCCVSWCVEITINDVCFINGHSQ